MKKNVQVFIILLMLIFTQNIFSEDWKELVNLRGQWKFNIGDNEDWSKYNYNDDQWDEIRVPNSWEDEGYYDYNGYAWYRYSFDVPKEIKNKSIYLSLGYIDDVDEVYLNGKLVGASGDFPPRFKTAYNAHRKYSISSKNFHTDKENILAVRVYDSQLAGGIVNGDIAIMYLESINLELNLEGYWNFSIGDSLKWKEPDYDDSNWDSIIVPSNWEIQGYDKYDGYAWYRKTFTIDESFDEDMLVVMLGKIDDIDQCYLNGVMIGGIGDFDQAPKWNDFNNEWLQIRGYYIRSGLLNFNGKNVISVRVYDGLQGGGIYHGPVGIATQKEYRDYWKSKKRNKSFWDYIFNK